MLEPALPKPPTYKIVLDNAFGLTQGAELRVAGVKVGKVTSLDIQRRTARAVVTTEIERTDFGRLHADATLKTIKEAGEVLRLQTSDNPDQQNSTRSKRGFVVQLVLFDYSLPFACDITR